MFAVVVVLAAFAYFSQIRGERPGSRAPVGSPLFDGVEAPAIVEIRLGFDAPGPFGDDPVRAIRRESGWRIVEPVETPAHSAAFDAMAQTLSGLMSARRIEDPASPAVYGLADPERGGSGEDLGMRIVFRAARTHTLWLGDEAPVGRYRYAAVRHDDQAVRLQPQHDADRDAG